MAKECITLSALEEFIKRINIILEKEESHLNWLMDSKIRLLNRRFGNYTDSIDTMISASEHYVDFYKMRLEEYTEYKDNLIKEQL